MTMAIKELIKKPYKYPVNQKYFFAIYIYILKATV